MSTLLFGAGAALALGAAAYFGLPSAAAAFLRGRRKRNLSGIKLSFEAGPCPEATPRILAALDDARLRAVFYFCGEDAERHPDLVRLARARGHEVASHGFRKVDHWRSWPWDAVRDMDRGREAVRRALGDAAAKVAYRPPAGRLVLPTLVAAAIGGHELRFWSFDPGTAAPELPNLEDRLGDLLLEPAAVVRLPGVALEDPVRQDYADAFLEGAAAIAAHR